MGLFRSHWGEPATDRQKEYADSLGVPYLSTITKGDLSDLIAKKTGRSLDGRRKPFLSGCGCLIMSFMGLVVLAAVIRDDGDAAPMRQAAPLEAIDQNRNHQEVLRQQAQTPVNIPADVQVAIIDSEIIPNIKRSLDVRLSRKVSEVELEAIGRSLTNEDGQEYERTFIGYLLPDMEAGAGYWATTHSNPNFQVQILGLTIEQEAAFQSLPNDPSKTILGCWLLEGVALGHRYTLQEQAGTTSMVIDFKDGSSTANIVDIRSVPKGIVVRKTESSQVTDYWLVDADGMLHFGDEDGIWKSADKTMQTSNMAQLRAMASGESDETFSDGDKKLSKAGFDRAVKRAESKIFMTKQLLLKRNTGEPQARWMREVIEELPGTDLAKEAAEMLRQIEE